MPGNKKALTPSEKVLDWRYLIVWRNQQALTVDIRRTRENFQRILYIWTTGMNPEIMELTMEKSERSVVAWKRFNDKHMLDPKHPAFREKATEAFEKELETFLSLKPAQRYAAVVEVDPKVRQAVLEVYESDGEAGSWTIGGQHYDGVKVQAMTLLGKVMAKLKVSPENLDNLAKQIKAIQSGPDFRSERGRVGTIYIGGTSGPESEPPPKMKKR